MKPVVPFHVAVVIAAIGGHPLGPFLKIVRQRRPADASGGGGAFPLDAPAELDELVQVLRAKQQSPVEGAGKVIGVRLADE